MDPWRRFFWVGACRLEFGAHTNTRENNGYDGVPTPASFILTAAIQSGRRGARRYQSHQRTQVNVLWQRGGRGWLRG